MTNRVEMMREENGKAQMEFCKAIIVLVVREEMMLCFVSTLTFLRKHTV